MDTQQLDAPRGSTSVNRRPRFSQPADLINVDGALLKLETVARLSGRGISTLYRDAQLGILVLTKDGTRFTRVSSENARAYLARLAGEVTT